MKIHFFMAVALTLLLQPARSEEMCSVLKTEGGRSIWVKESCSQRETPMPCTRTTKDARGSLVIEDVPCAPWQQKTVQQVEREREAEQRRQCGADFGKLRIGMTLDRYEECTESLDLVSEKVTSAGTAELYRGMFYFIEARDGKIVGFKRRTR